MHSSSETVCATAAQNIERLCCGMMFDSRGAQSAARAKTEETTQALLAASEMGKLPIVCDTSPCLAQLKAGINPELRWEQTVTSIVPCALEVVAGSHCALEVAASRNVPLPSSCCHAWQTSQSMACLAMAEACVLVLCPMRRFSLYEPVRFIELFLKDNLEFTQV